EWNRVRDDVSSATIQVSANQDSAQAEMLAQLAGATGRYELCIWRDGKRVWEGPITRVAFTREVVEIEARDVMHYTYRLFMTKDYDHAYPNNTKVVLRSLDILTYVLTRKDTVEMGVGLPSVNVLPYVVGHQPPPDAETSRKTVPYQYEVFEHIDDMAAKA